MIEIRPARENEIEEQKRIWRAGFGDPPSYIDLFYSNRYRKEETLLLLKNKIIAAMLTLWPVTLVTPGNRYPATMLYAIVRHPRYRQQGLAAKLLKYVHDCLKESVYTILVPATPPLFNYYHEQGYRVGFYLREVSLSRQQILENPAGRAGDIYPVAPEDYNKRRENFLAGKSFVSYRDEDILYQKTVSRHFNGDIYGIDIDGCCGCAAIERDAGKALVKELLCPDSLMPAAVQSIAQLLQVNRYIIRTPAFSGEILQGSVSPFGMIRAGGETDRGLKPKNMGHLGLAFD